MKRSLWVIACVSIIVGCGDEGSSPSKEEREFGQGIDLVRYQLKSADLKIDLGSSTGVVERLRRNVTYLPEKSKDKILRKIDGPIFKLQINNQDALVDVSSQENINHVQKISEDNPACTLSGFSKVYGQATSIDLDLNWNLQMELRGSGCDAFTDKYQSFLAAELARFNLTVVGDLLKSADLLPADQRKIVLNLKISGES